MKIGILGGTFSPVHNGHIEIAKIAKARLELDKVLFIPNKVPPHKDIGKIDIFHKVNMVKSAIEDIPYFDIDTFETDSDNISYSYITLSYLSEKYKGDELYFILGADNIKQISNWMKPELIFKYANIVFIKRPNFVLDNSIIKKLTNLYNGKISVINFIGIDVSSTEIRKKSEEFKSLKGYVPQKVINYIYENAIYPVKAKEKLCGMLNEKRYIHSINVAKEAYKLAKQYNADEEKAYYAGLLHDCAKDIPLEKQFELIDKYNEYEIMEDELEFSKVIHALCGPIVAKKEFNVEDKEILDAIRYHTLGSINMTMLDKIIYIADLISEDRLYTGVEKLRELSYENIDKAIIMSIENTISYLGEDRIQKDVLRLKCHLKNNLRGDNV